MIEEHKILAFHERELETILSKLKLLEKIQKGEIKCAFCGKTITQENFGALLKRGNNILIICDDPSCIEKARSD
jgi:hypothetical protein